MDIFADFQGNRDDFQEDDINFISQQGHASQHGPGADQASGFDEMGYRPKEEATILIEIDQKLKEARFNPRGNELRDDEVAMIRNFVQRIPRVDMYNADLLVVSLVFLTKDKLMTKQLKSYATNMKVNEIDLLRYIRFVKKNGYGK